MIHVLDAVALGCVGFIVGWFVYLIVFLIKEKL